MGAGAGVGSQKFASDESGKQHISFQSGRSSREGKLAEVHSVEVAAKVGCGPPSCLAHVVEASGSPAKSTFDIANCSTVDSLPPMLEDIDERTVDLEIDFDKIGSNWRRQASASDELDEIYNDWQRQRLVKPWESASDELDEIGNDWQRQRLVKPWESASDALDEIGATIGSGRG